MAKLTPWGVHHLSSMTGSPHATTALPDGREVRAVPEPYWTFGRSRLRAAWWVLTGRAHAVVWPRPGDLEAALKEQNNG